ncbi:unnamed protein product [marine sediment metagenome]|uniref:Uncharacterized protein n=1 Tax=marine sediment metagenome TaxID=412755 RepID=X1N586_9ZZZZ
MSKYIGLWIQEGRHGFVFALLRERARQEGIENEKRRRSKLGGEKKNWHL